MSWRQRLLPQTHLAHVIMALTTSFIILSSVAAWVFRADIFEALIDPGAPFQLSTPPPEPDYTLAESWALTPTPGPSTNQLTDVFFIHPTTYDGGRDWNGAISDAQSNHMLDAVMLPNYAGPFTKVGRVFAPRYRQASLYAMLTMREDAREARQFAYSDVKAAFDAYMRLYNQGRPIIIVGVEQGGVLADRLTRVEIASDPQRLAQLVAVYAVETAMPAERFSAEASIPACTRRSEAGCMVAWLSEGFDEGYQTRQRLKRAAVWNGDRLTSFAPNTPLCVNPLTGATDSEHAARKHHLGAANATGLEWGAEPGFMANQVSAQCEKGILKVSRPKSPSLRGDAQWVNRQRVRGFNLFYADLQADAQARVTAWREH